jgi:hypothetical protein
MRKSISILMLGIILFSQAELHQFFKLPVLFEHFREHRLEDPAITFFTFLKLHYEKIVVDDDYQRDQQLPFRDIDCTIAFAVITDTPPSLIGFEQKIPVVTTEFYAKNITDYSHQHLHDIFQPPRFS